jgi:hypothetical protein
VSATLQSLGNSISNGLKVRQRDPLAYWTFAVPRLREAFSMFTASDPIRELHLRGPNKGTKTETTAAFVTRCCQKARTLDGVKLPQWRGKVEAAHLVLDFKQQLLSVQPAYERVLGDWPHHVRKQGEAWSSVAIMPIGGDESDESSWSIVHFLTQKNEDTGVGVRADIVAFDEPPKMRILQELRKAAHAGREALRIIAYTPTKPRQWRPLRADAGDTPRRSLAMLGRGRAVCRWSLDEVADRVLSQTKKREMREDYSGDPLFGEDGGARWHGDFTNVEGACPFDSKTLFAMIDAWVREPQLRRINVAIEDPDGRPKHVETVSVEVWSPPMQGQACYQVVDPASGVDDAAHNPAGLQVGEESTGDLQVRWNGYLAPYSLGSLAAALHRHYDQCGTDIEMMDHWGVNVLRGYEQNGGSNLCYEQRELRPGEWAKEVGFRVRDETRAIWIGCIQEWIAAFKAGTPYAICPSRDVLECLLDMELDDRDKAVAGPGVAHAEDFVLLGQRLRRLERPQREMQKPYAPEANLERAMMREAMRPDGERRGRVGHRRLTTTTRRPL